HYLENGPLAGGIRAEIARRMLDRLQAWDRASSRRVDRFIANSAFVRERIARCYEREADVIFPPVDYEFFAATAAHDAIAQNDYYVTASRFVPYKRIDLIIAAFRGLLDRRLVVVGDGPEAARIHAVAGRNVEFVGEVSRERLRDLLAGARAFVF